MKRKHSETTQMDTSAEISEVVDSESVKKDKKKKKKKKKEDETERPESVDTLEVEVSSLLSILLQFVSLLC